VGAKELANPELQVKLTDTVPVKSTKDPLVKLVFKPFGTVQLIRVQLPEVTGTPPVSGNRTPPLSLFTAEQLAVIVVGEYPELQVKV
jgi:hypothetical protein